MTKREYVSSVMRRMNELGWDDSYSGAFFGGDSTKVERQVVACFCDAWRKGVDALPLSYFNSVSFEDAELFSDVSQGTGFVVLPSDFYILSSFRMRGWKRDCFAAVEETDAIAAIQSNDFVRGNVYRPVCTLFVHPRYGSIMKYYSVHKGSRHFVESALYVPLHGGIAGLGDSDDLGLDERLYGPLAWLNAGVVFSVFEKEEMAKAAFSFIQRKGENLFNGKLIQRKTEN